MISKFINNCYYHQLPAIYTFPRYEREQQLSSQENVSPDKRQCDSIKLSQNESPHSYNLRPRNRVSVSFFFLKKNSNSIEK